MKLDEYVTQTMYVLLLLIYLANLLELVIIYFNPTAKIVQAISDSSSETSTTVYDIVPFELFTSILMLTVHVFEYGFAYGSTLWLTSPSSSSSLIDSQRAHPKYCYVLNSFAFVYNTIQATVTAVKLSLLAWLFSDHDPAHHLTKLLKPYILLAMFLVQSYFAWRHFSQLRLIVSRWKYAMLFI